VDALLDVDWNQHWQDLVQARDLALGARNEDFWERRASRLVASAAPAEPVLKILRPYLYPAQTLIDVGGGTGRYAEPLAEALDWVTVIEPSAAMRDRIPPLANLTVVGSRWEDADVQPAGLVLCSHVLYWVEDPAAFIEKLEGAATERVFLILRDSAYRHPAEAAIPIPREPRLRDAFNLLRWMGRAPEVSYWATETCYRFSDLEDAVESCRTHLGRLWDETRARAWLESHLQPGDQGVVYHGPQQLVGALHWQPGSP
jgi:SAM-dependent methyltransferase